MTVILADVFGSPNIGIYCFCSEKLVVLPPGLTERKIRLFEDSLRSPVCTVTIARSSLLGVLIAANSNGIIVPRTLADHEATALKRASDLAIYAAKERWTAYGNMILLNDYGAIVDPVVPQRFLTVISDSLGIEAVKGTIGGLPYVGSLAVATNSGVIAHPSIRFDEAKLIEEVLKVPVERGTINGGVPFVRSGLMANSRGAVAGSLTRGSELLTITRTLSIT